MIFYEFRRPNVELIKQNEVIYDFDDLIFYNVEDENNIGKFYLPFTKEFSKDDFHLARYLIEGTKTDYNEKGEKVKTDLTDEDKKTALEVFKEMKIIKLRKYYENLLANGFTELSIEKDSWERQKTEADLYTSNNDANVPFITTLAKSRGIKLSDLVNKIQEKAQKYTLFVASTLGTQHKQEHEIKDCTSVEDLSKLELPDFCTFYFER